MNFSCRERPGGEERTGRMKKGDIIQGTIEYVNFPNKGVMHTDQGSCIIKNTLPGQKVEGRVTKKRSGKAEASLLQVLDLKKL